MEKLNYILLLFSLLFLIERKAINVLLSFVGIVVTIAIKISLDEGLNSIDGEYFSYILILVQVSALTILFGFIIMLYPSLSPLPPNPHTQLHCNISPKDQGVIKTLKRSSRFEKGDIIKNYSWVNKTPSGFSKSLILLATITIGAIIYIKIYGQGLDSFSTTAKPLVFQVGGVEGFLNSDTIFLRKLGYYLYTDNSNIIKLLFLTMILLLAIVSLFFLV